jgi:hypothetical protein
MLKSEKNIQFSVVNWVPVVSLETMDLGSIFQDDEELQITI